MPRDCFRDTIVRADADGILHALEGVKVYIYYANTDDLADVYTGPTAMALANNPIVIGGPKGILTSANGVVEFYAEPGEYKISIEDTRLGGTAHEFRWNAVNGSPGGIQLFQMGADIRRQMAQIGEIIDWWRPVNTVPLPDGWAICNGQVIAAGNHDFRDNTGTLLGAVTLPDLRGLFVMGADVLKPDRSATTDGQSAASANGDGTTLPTVQNPRAPGIGGKGGTNATFDLSHNHDFTHQHDVPFIDHVHSGTAPDHLHTAGGLLAVDHTHPVAKSGFTPVQWFAQYATFDADNHATQLPNRDHTHAAGLNGVTGTGVVGFTGLSTDGAGTPTGGLSFTTLAAKDPATGTTPVKGRTPAVSMLTLTAGNAVADLRPAHIGLLKLMKVRRA